MFSTLNKVLLISIAASAAVFSNSFNKNLLPVFNFGLLHSAYHKQEPKTLAKRAALEWKQTGSTHYTNISDPVAWTVDTRDTIIYDAAGNQTLFKTTNAHSGWKTDSLESVDSSVYSGGNCSEYYNFKYKNNTYTGTRSIYTSLNGGKAIVTIQDEWDFAKNKWQTTKKDSMFYSAPANITDTNFIDTSYGGNYSYDFDTISATWKCSEYSIKIPAECNATTLVFSGRKRLYETGELVDMKQKLTFKTAGWQFTNLAETYTQIKDTTASVYQDYIKSTYSSNENETFQWDITNKKLNVKYKELTDAHGNDTLLNYNVYDTSLSVWDTVITRYERSYDAGGNNIQTVESDFDNTDNSWFMSAKDVNAFIQTTVPVLPVVKMETRNKMTMHRTRNVLNFAADGITGIDIYNAEGRLLTTVRQKAAPAMTLDLTGIHAFSTGMYIAKVLQKNKSTVFTVSNVQ